MGINPTKAAGNIYCQCRKAAAKYNEKLNSREGAAELLNISVSSLTDYELGLTKVVPVEKVKLMSDLYNAPELESYYCRNECPLGDKRQVLELSEIDRLTVKLIHALRNVNEIQTTILDLDEDGVISDEELPVLESMISALEKISIVTEELKIFAIKRKKGNF